MSKTEQSVVICTPTILMLLQKLKLGQHREFVYLSPIKNSDQKHVPVNFRNSCTGRKFSVLAQNQVNYHP